MNDQNSGLKSSAFVRFENKHGKAWSGSNQELADEFSAAYLADGFAKQLRAIVATSLRHQYPNLVVHIVVLPLADSRLFVWRHSDYPQEYVLAIHFGTFARAVEIASRPKISELIQRECPHLAHLHANDLTRLAAYLLVSALAYHEMAHIFRGHLGFTNALELRSEQNHSAHVALWRSAVSEADADRWSSVLLAGDIVSTARQLRVNSRCPDNEEHIAHELLLMTAACLYRQFAMFNSLELSLPTLYPHPLLRATTVAIGALDNLWPNRPASPSLWNGLYKVLVGLGDAERCIQSEDLGQRPWDIAKELQSFRERYEELLEGMRKRLAEYSPAKS